jgi:hypothetical protein
MYWPEIAHPVMPKIPSQSALVVYRDGVETLVVESTLDAEAQSLGWVVPVPEVPSAFAEASPGVLRTAWHVTAPEVIHESRGMVTATLAACYVVLVPVVFFLVRRKVTVIPVLLVYLMTLLVLSAFATLSAKAGLDSAVAGAPALIVHKATIVGSYEISVLEAETGGALGEWLSSNGFTAPDRDALRIIEAYVRDGWVFVAARLRREEKGLSTPHPLSITFAAARPVYPMRLTVLSGVPLDLELYVVADGTAGAEGLSVDFCDVLHGPVKSIENVHPPTETWPHFNTQETGRSVGHPGLLEFLWDGCVLTKLSGTFPPELMVRDVEIALSSVTPYVLRRYSTRWAGRFAFCCAAVLWTAVVAGGTMAGRSGIRAPGGILRFLLSRVLPITLGAPMLSVAAYFAVPTVPVKVLPGHHYHRLRHRSEGADLCLLARHVVEKEEFAGESPEDFRTFLAERFRADNVENFVSGGPLAVEDSPGNYIIYEDEGDIVFRAFGRYGMPREIKLNSEEEQPSPG